MLRSVFLSLLTLLLGYRLKTTVITVDIDDEYDFIIVGGGTTGCAVAGRLSEDPSIRILVLEAGESDLTVPDLFVPFSNVGEGSKTTWGYQTTPQKHASQDTVGKINQIPRGKILGGTSSINHMIYNRGSPYDYDSWKKHGAEGWAWKDVEKYFKKAEKSAHPQLSDKLGRNGALNIDLEYTTPLTNIFEEAALEIGFNKTDYIDDMEGISRCSITSKNGLRQNSVEGYLRGVFPERKNRLHIATKALVTKIVFCEEEIRPRACAVQYLKDGKIKTVRARKEIILSAGAIATPKLLMLSGVGPREHLEEHNIPVILDLPGVGQNFQDHVKLVLVYYSDNMPDGTIVTKKLLKDRMRQYMFNGTGPISASAGVAALMHFRTEKGGTPVSTSTNSNPYPEIQIVFTNMEQTLQDFQKLPISSEYKIQDFVKEFVDATTMRNGMVATFVMAVGLMHPKSTGTISLASNDPMSLPLIDPNYLANKDDVEVFIEGMRVAEKLQASRALQQYGIKLVFQPYCDTEQNNKLPRTDDFYKCLLKSSARSEYHQCCTAKIGNKKDKMAVVDARLRVFGTNGLRVADASVMPHLTSANTQATCYMIAEKAADMIKEDWGLVR